MQARVSPSLVFPEPGNGKQIRDEHIQADMLLNKYADLLYGAIVRIVKDDKAAEEVLKDVITHVVHEAKQFQAGHLKVVTQLIHFAKKKALEKADVISRGSSPVGARKQLVEELLSKLTADERQLAEWIVLEGRSQNEVAETLHLPLPVIRSRTRAVMVKIREWSI
jgi:DNA-directed RNA polymerase specialized sigma24 family protein